MTKEELRNYCYSLSMVDCVIPEFYPPDSVHGFTVSGKYIDKADFIAAYDDSTNSVILANKCEIYQEFNNTKPVRMFGSYSTYDLSDEEIKKRINKLINTANSLNKWFKDKEISDKIEKIKGDFK